MRRDVNSVGEEKVAESKRSARSVFGKYLEPVKKACMYAALPVFLTVAGCAAKNTDVKSSNDKAMQEKGLVAVEDVENDPVNSKDVKEVIEEVKKNCVELDEKTAKETYEKIKEKCGDDNNCFIKEAENMNICESNDVKGDKAEDTGLLEKSAVGGLLYILPNVPAEDLKGIKIVLNEKLANCGGKECEIPVKADSLLIRVEIDNENKDYIELKVAKVDEKGVYLDLGLKVLGKLSKSGPKYYRVNFGGGKAAVFADGHETALPEAFHHFDSVLAIAGAEKAEAKPSEKAGEATLILYMKGEVYGEMKMKTAVAMLAIKMGTPKYMMEKKVGYEPQLKKMIEPIKETEKIKPPRAHALIACVFEKGRCVEKAYEGDVLISLKEIGYRDPFEVAGVHVIGIEKVGKEGVELDVRMNKDPENPIRVELKYGEKKEIGEEQKLTITVKKAKKEDQVTFIIKQPKGYKKEPKMLELESKAIPMYGEEEPKKLAPLIKPEEKK